MEHIANMNELSGNYLVLLNLVKNALRNINVGLPQVNTVNYDLLLRLSIKNGIANTVADGIATAYVEKYLQEV